MKFRNLKMYGNIIALIITFGLCGLWHGASWMFLLWGTIHGLFMSVSLFIQKPKNKFYKKIGLANTKFLKFGQIFITFHLLTFAWVFFRVDDFEIIGQIFNQIFYFFKPSVLPQFIAGYTPTFAILILGYILHFLPRSLEKKTADILTNIHPVFQAVIFAAVIWICAQVQSADLQPFIYFQF